MMFQLSTFTQSTALMAATLPIVVRETLEDYADFDIPADDAGLIETLRTNQDRILNDFEANYSRTISATSGLGRDGALLLFHRRIAHAMPEGFRNFLDRAANDQWYGVIDRKTAVEYYFERLARGLETGALEALDLSEIAQGRGTAIELGGFTALRVEQLSDYGLTYEDIGVPIANRSDRPWLDRQISDMFAVNRTLQEELALVEDIGLFQFKATEEQRLVVVALLERLLPVLQYDAQLEAAYYLSRAIKDPSILVQSAAFDVLFNLEEASLARIRERALLSATAAEDQELRHKALAFQREVHRARVAEMNKDQAPVDIQTSRFLD